MRLGTRLFFTYLLIFTCCFSYPIAKIADELRIRYLEGVEEPLVDQANILAGLIGREMETGRFNAEELYQTFEGIRHRVFAAQIYDVLKSGVDVRVYITDLSGKAIFDSAGREWIGHDYSNWRDIRLTLQGAYGARTTRLNSTDSRTAVLHVAAPIFIKGVLAGVLTIAKPTTSINAMLDAARPRIFHLGLLSGIAAVLLSFLVSLWVHRQIQKLTHYAHAVREGRRVPFPVLANTELKEMGTAFEQMRESLDGKSYVEQYVQTLTHELKSPVSAIRGAAELMTEEMPVEKRKQFLGNIRLEADRIQDLVERMLKLSELETKKSLSSVENIQMPSLVRTILESKAPAISKKELTIDSGMEESLSLMGDPFLLHQAVSNLIQNAIDFSPQGGVIQIHAASMADRFELTVQDQGPGIPEYAQKRVFERFFSLQRPDTGKKSTGLGLNFTKEVAALHHGEILLENQTPKGLRATLRLGLNSGDTRLNPNYS